MNRESRRDKDLKNTYLWVDREGSYGEKYEEILLYKQSVPGLITFYEVEENEEKGLVYVLEHQNSFLEELAGKRMTCAHMKSFIKSLVQVMETIDEYLLEPSNLVVEMSYIFGSIEGWKYVYIPGYGEDFWRQMEKLSEEWLNYVDYGNEKAVLWAYTFYQKVHGESCFPEELLEILNLEKSDAVDKPQMIQEESVLRENEKEKNVKKEGLAEYLTRRFKKIVSGKKRRNEDVFEDFYGSKTNLGETCPDLGEVTDALNFQKKQEQTFVLIPMGDNEMPVIHVDHFPFLLGRAPEEVDILLNNLKISRIHARLEGNGQEVKIVDLSSANGTCRNEECLKPGAEYVLHSGDILKLADLEFICQWC